MALQMELPREGIGSSVDQGTVESGDVQAYIRPSRGIDGRQSDRAVHAAEMQEPEGKEDAVLGGETPAEDRP